MKLLTFDKFLNEQKAPEDDYKGDSTKIYQITVKDVPNYYADKYSKYYGDGKNSTVDISYKGTLTQLLDQEKFGAIIEKAHDRNKKIILEPKTIDELIEVLKMAYDRTYPNSKIKIIRR